MEEKPFHLADHSQIKKGDVTDVYFTRVVSALEKAGIDRRVTAEVRASSFPADWRWAVFSGLEEARRLFSGKDVEVSALPEGSVFFTEEPVFAISGRYLDFAVFETALLGFLCQASGVATKAARCKLAAGARPVYSFGARRMHPGIAPMIERNAYVGGCDGVATVISGRLMGKEPIGTMSHSLILVVGSDIEAFKIFDRAMPDDVARVALVDTFNDEKFGALGAVEALGDRLHGVRLDTPKSRRGNFLKILQEVRWELDIRGHKGVKIMVSGGVDEDVIAECNRYADAYGVGTAISNAPVVDFSMDIVEVEGELRAKRGKMSGKKQIARCPACGLRQPVRPDTYSCPNCGGTLEMLVVEQIKVGEIVAPHETVDQIRARAISQYQDLSIDE